MRYCLCVSDGPSLRGYGQSTATCMLVVCPDLFDLVSHPSPVQVPLILPCCPDDTGTCTCNVLPVKTYVCSEYPITVLLQPYVM